MEKMKKQVSKPVKKIVEKQPIANRQFADWITIEKAREHNLKEVTVSIPKGALTVITGPSGSGKSSLALDVLYTEGKRRYMDSLSSYARQFLGIAKKPDVERIEGLCPAIAIEQKTVGHNPRSTVGTITEIYDYLRVLFARIGTPHCPHCALPIKQESPEHVTSLIIKNFAGQTITILAPVVQQKRGEFRQELIEFYNNGYHRMIIDDTPYRFTHEDELKKVILSKKIAHTISLVLDQVTITDSEYSRIHEDIEKAFSLAGQNCAIMTPDKKVFKYSALRMCLHCSYSFPELEPRLFSFNSPIGACTDCNGLGISPHHWWRLQEPQDSDSDKVNKMQPEDNSFVNFHSIVCSGCHGNRLNKDALAVHVGGKTIMSICDLSIEESLAFVKQLKFSEEQLIIAQGLLREITNRLTFLFDVGLDYLTLSRAASTLSGGEGQRIRLATQIGSSLSGVLYVLDEPSIGLHQRDNDRLIQTLKTLRDQGNTVLVVEHDIDTMKAADYLIDMGPAAGAFGGQVMAAGTPEQIAANSRSLTGAYLTGSRGIVIPKQRRTTSSFLILGHATKNNLKNITVRFPLKVFCCISGVSGSGKSTLIVEELVPAIKQALQRKNYPEFDAQKKQLSGIEHIDSLVAIDQSPIGRSSRSNPATYLGIFDDMRRLFAQLPESKARGYLPGRFSFNVAEGRCFECRGEGTITVSMQFLPDVVMICKHCKGQRYNAETLSITYKGKNIAQILDMTAQEAMLFFAAHGTIEKRLKLMCDVGLDYIKLGQPSPTLSGGEAQRIKLVEELSKRGTNTLYILDEPTTGLHNSDIEKLLLVINRLVDKGNSMIVIEHNLDVIKTADHIIDLGPEGGRSGGLIVAQGTPEEVAKNKSSHTGRYLKPLLI